MTFDFLKSYYIIIVDFIRRFLESPSSLPSFLHTIGIALLTILISISIAMFSGERKFIKLDKNVILDKIFRPKRFLSILGLIFVPILFWHVSNFEFKIIELALWIIGISKMMNILKNSYLWIKGDRYKYRFNYLNNLRADKDLVESMRSIWEEGEMDIKSEKEFLRIFAVKIEQNMKINYKLTSEFLNDFRIFLNGPKVCFFVLQDTIVPKILKWHYSMWELEKNRKGSQDKGIESPNSIGNYLRMRDALEKVFLEVEKHSLKEGLVLELYFRSLTVHIEGLLEKVDDTKKILEYFKYFFKTFYSAFFSELSNIPEINEMWYYYFPREWKIITENYAKDSLSSYSFKNFCNWARERIIQAKENVDYNLDEATNGLFPEVDHGIWAIILIFVLLPVSEEKNRIDNVIKHPWNFGKVVVCIGKVTEERFNNAVKLAKLLFKEQFSKRNLENYISVLSKLSTKYQKDIIYENKAQELLMIFKKMLKK